MDKKNRKEIETNAPKHEELSVQPTFSALSDTQETFPGDSVDEHKNLESANKAIGIDEVKQQFENL
jgi:hypothetical protein